MSAMMDAAPWLPDLFFVLWERLVPCTSDLNSGGWQGRRAREADRIREEIRKAPSGETPQVILRYLQGADPIDFGRPDVPATEPDQRAFVVAQSIDEIFEVLHPRYPGSRLEGGLLEIDRYYRENGRFNKATSHALVLPKAPLRAGRTRRRPGVSSNQLQDRFEHLLCFKDPVPSSHVVSPRKLDSGGDPDVDLIETGGVLRLALIPLAERGDDLILETLEEGEGWLDVRPRDEEREQLLAEAAESALRAAEDSGVHVALFPELTVSPVAQRAIRETLRDLARKTGGRPSLQLVVAGSGLTEETHPKTGLPYNESVVFGRAGQVLWRQRKLNHYLVSTSRLKSYGVRVGRRSTYREHFHAGQELHVVDGSLGRMVVLVCQDLYESVPGERVMDQLRPDWAFCPVLDAEMEVGRWYHQRALPLAERFGVSTVVVNSLTLPRRAEPNRRRLGFALGVDGDNAFRFRLAKCWVPSQGSRPRCEVVPWTPEHWDDETRIGGRKAPRKP